MAELDFDSEDLVDDSLDDEDSLDQRTVSGRSSASQSRRRIIIGGAIALVFIVALSLFGFRIFRNDSQTISTTQSLSYNQGTQPEAAPKKKSLKKVKFTELYDLPSNQVMEVLQELSLAGITFKTEQRGQNITIEVDEDELGQAINLLSVKGLPSGKPTGYGLLDEGQTLGVTEFDKRVRFIRAKEGELEKTIIQFSKITRAKVQIVWPESRLFAVTQPPVTASILIRKALGARIDDDTVLSIIKLVAGAVENLQLENISVIEEEGQVLSDGIFERIALREAGLQPEEAPQIGLERDSVEVDYLPPEGQPIVPNTEELQQWHNLKSTYENELVLKASNQLMGVLPEGSYKVAVAAEIGPVSDESQAVDIRKLSVSVVVDNSRDDLYLDDELTLQVFNTVAGVIGYEENRDVIVVSSADFSLEEAPETSGDEVVSATNSFYLKVILGIIGTLILVGTAFGIFRFRNSRKTSEDVPLQPNGDEDSDNFSELAQEMEQSRRIDELKSLAQSDPDVLVELIESWLETNQLVEVSS